MAGWFETCRECNSTIEMNLMSQVDGPRHQRWKEEHHTKRCVAPVVDQLTFQDHIKKTYGVGLYNIKNLFEGWDL